MFYSKSAFETAVQEEVNRRLVKDADEIFKQKERGWKEIRDYECTWHNKREKLNIEVAQLEAKKEYLETLTKLMSSKNEEREKALEWQLNSLNTECKDLYDIIDKLINKIPSEINLNFDKFTRNK